MAGSNRQTTRDTPRADYRPQGGDSKASTFGTLKRTFTEFSEDNLTDWALTQFRTFYADPAIEKPDIFHYVYALLHHPTYRTTYAANLKRELPRLPLVTTREDFRRFAHVACGGCNDRARVGVNLFALLHSTTHVVFADEINCRGLGRRSAAAVCCRGCAERRGA